MDKDLPEQDTPQDDTEYARPDPKLNPRNQILKEIADGVAKQHEQDFAETAPVIDDEHNPVETPPPAQVPEAPASSPPPPASPAPAASPPSDGVEAVDPSKLYEVTVDGQKVQVPGSKIIEAGFRTFQKETAADFRLNVASQLLREAQERARGVPPPASTSTPPADSTPPGSDSSGPSDADLAKALQFGTPEQAADALKVLRGRGAVTPQQIQTFVTQQSRQVVKDELQFQDAVNFVKEEYGDLLKNDYLKRLFFVEENRRRATGDHRPYKDLYKEIGEELRKAFNLPRADKGAASGSPTPPAPGSAAARTERKAATPSVPRTAAARLTEGPAAAKPKSPSEIIADMAARRGKTRLTQPSKET